MARKKTTLNEGKIEKVFAVNGKEYYLVDNLIGEIGYFTVFHKMADADTYLRVYSIDDVKRVEKNYLDKATDTMLNFKPSGLKMDIFSYGDSKLCAVDTKNKILYDWYYKVSNGDVVVVRAYKDGKETKVLVEEARLSEDFPKVREIVEENLLTV